MNALTYRVPSLLALRNVTWALLPVLAFIGLACGNDTPTEPDPGGNPEVNIPLDKGNMGLVIDVREIFRKGYVPTEAEINFQAYPQFNDTLDIDPVTTLSVLSIPRDSLTVEEEAAFADGVPATITVRDGASNILTNFQNDRLVLDDSNLPLRLTTNREHILRPLNFREGAAYLLQIEGDSGLLTSLSDDFFELEPFNPGVFTQQFYFTPVPGSDPDTYWIEHHGYESCGTFLSVDPEGSELQSNVQLTGNQCNWLDPSEFVLEQDTDGWVEIRVKGTNRYLHRTDYGLKGTESITPDRFRIISDSIDWQLEDRGTVFHEPVMPPVQLDFAYEAILKNCSPATLTETVGKSESRTRSTTMSTSESLQLFSSQTISESIKMGVTIGAKLDGLTEVSVNEEVTVGYQFTTSQTTTTENTISETTTETTEVSRTRELKVPPNTAVHVYDAIQTIENVRFPFTQKLRIRGTHKHDGTPLSGAELVTQALFNHVGGVVSDIGDNYVTISIRGFVRMENLFKATTEAKEITGACDI